MFEPTLLGITPDQFWGFFLSLLSPMLGFMFLFLLGLPLKAIPLVKDLTNYEPPGYILPVFALGTLFLTSFAIWAIFFLNVWRETPNPLLFGKTFTISRHIPPFREILNKVTLRLDSYDHLSNFRVIVNV
jgi:hypothetical protein